MFYTYYRYCNCTKRYVFEKIKITFLFRCVRVYNKYVITVTSTGSIIILHSIYSKIRLRLDPKRDGRLAATGCVKKPIVAVTGIILPT